MGLPAKSGVGGGIVAIVPHEMAIAVWSRNWMMQVTRLRVLPSLNLIDEQLGRSVLLMRSLDPLFARLSRSNFALAFVWA